MEFEAILTFRWLHFFNKRDSKVTVTMGRTEREGKWSRECEKIKKLVKERKWSMECEKIKKVVKER